MKWFENRLQWMIGMWHLLLPWFINGEDCPIPSRMTLRKPRPMQARHLLEFTWKRGGAYLLCLLLHEALEVTFIHYFPPLVL